MRRVVLLLIVTSVVMFAVVLKTPLQTLRSAVFPEDDSAPVTQVPQKHDVSSKGTSAKSRSATSSHEPELAAGRSISKGAVLADEAKEPGKQISRNSVSFSTLTISADSVALYSINSTQGSILRQLERGTVVVPTLQVMDGDVNWVLVKVPEFNVSGFIQADKIVPGSGR